MMRYAVVIEKAKRNYSAYAPDIPGCVAAGKTVKETKKLMREAIEFHLEGMMLDGDAVPKPTSSCCFLDVQIPKIDKKLNPRRSRATG